MVKQQLEREGNLYLTLALGELNKAGRMKATFQSAFGGEEYSVVVSKTETYLQALAAAVNEPSPAPPAVTTLGNAPIEVWVRAKDNDAVSAEIEKLWKEAEPELVKLLAGFKDADQVVAQFIKSRVVGEWVVFRIGASLAFDGASKE